MRSIIIEGCDRLGKGTLVEGLQHRFGYFQVVHYQKPQVLKFYEAQYGSQTIPVARRESLRRYQYYSFETMFHMLSSPGRFIMDRAHLGETVYAPRYRGYDGSYISDLERRFRDACEQTLLVLLTTSSWSFISDDGLSFDASKRGEEQVDFISAFEKSIISNKVMVDVNDHGKFRAPELILEAVSAAFER